MIYEGRVYETDGTQAIAIHEGADVRLNAPIVRPGVTRVYAPHQAEFQYANPHAFFGPSETLLPSKRAALEVWPGLAWVIGGHGERVDPMTADDLILGFSLALVFRFQLEGGAAFDAGVALGPMIVTPDEFDDAVVTSAQGRSYSDLFFAKRNGETALESTPEPADRQPAVLIAAASDTCALYEGDLFVRAFGRLAPVEAGDEIEVKSPRLGVLKIKVAQG